MCNNSVLLLRRRNTVIALLQAQQMTGVAVPSYYNPAAVNPLKYAEQLKKRKMLWSKGAKDTADKEKEVEIRIHTTQLHWLLVSLALNVCEFRFVYS